MGRIVGDETLLFSIFNVPKVSVKHNRKKSHNKVTLEVFYFKSNNNSFAGVAQH